MNTTDYFVVLDDAHTHSSRYYQGFHGFDALAASDLNQVDALLRQGWARGLQVVLWLPYDFGVDVVFGSTTAAMYLLWFERCDVCADGDERLPWRQPHAVPTGIAALHNTVAEADYLQHIQAIHDAITRGDVYQINYTTAWQGEVYGEPSALYARLRERQQVPYGVLAHLPPEVNAGAAWHLGFSPELFLQIQDDGVVRTKPMKGTAPILQDGLDAERAHTLQHDAKNRAENVMIVDLLRNDLGKLATIGGVTVPQAFEVAAFGSVWQMTSTVEATMRPDTTVVDIIQAAFPCGSITGAPKRMAMQLIAGLETGVRGMYTGSVGWLEPCDSGIGVRGTWNVVIRSLALREQSPQRYALNMGIGSGIVIDSVGRDEWDECLWKARFARGLPAAVAVMETMLVQDGVCALLPLHQARLAGSVRDLHLGCDEALLWQGLQAACVRQWHTGAWRVKVVVAADSEVSVTSAPLAAMVVAQQVCISPHRLPTHDVLRRYKTTERQLFDRVWQQAEQQGCFDALLFNQDGVLLEGGRSSVFVELNGQWYTPALALDVLDGVMRRAVMAAPEQYGFVGGVEEHAAITLALLQTASRLRLGNALRGVVDVECVDSLI